MSTMTDRLTERHDGRRVLVRPPGGGLDRGRPRRRRRCESVVIADAEQPVLIAASLEESPLETPALQVPGPARASCCTSTRRSAATSSGCTAASPSRGRTPPRRPRSSTATAIPARRCSSPPASTAPRIVTLQVHFPPSTADVEPPPGPRHPRLALHPERPGPTALTAQRPGVIVATSPPTIRVLLSDASDGRYGTLGARPPMSVSGLRRPGGSWPGSAGQRCLG